jgi:hypothetical protein
LPFASFRPVSKTKQKRQHPQQLIAAVFRCVSLEAALW